MRTDKVFSGAGLNIEGALALDHDRIRLFQRGNAEPHGLEPVDATADFSCAALCEHFTAPKMQAPPPFSNLRTYDLGTLGGVRLTLLGSRTSDQRTRGLLRLCRRPGEL
jgi:hypothetical protein